MLSFNSTDNREPSNFLLLSDQRNQGYTVVIVIKFAPVICNEMLSFNSTDDRDASNFLLLSDQRNKGYTVDVTRLSTLRGNEMIRGNPFCINL
jgi:hypothetical protein